ncbi:MAG: GWxTD domain-containing protein [Acidobacteriota bacterium]
MKRILLLSTCIGLVSVGGAFLPAGQQDAKKLRKEEAADYYKNWLEEDVVYLISKEERNVFSKLTSNEEREQFIEQFWARRDPDRSTAANEFKEEHYRRIAYANEHFKSGIPGWLTDRGQIYIKFGPPKERETYVSGGTYERPLTEGGGRTTTYPWERWFYRNIPGLGSGIEIEFVDPTLSGEYKIALRKSEKDALFNSEGSGDTLYEQMGVLTRADRLRADFAMRPLGLNNDSLVMDLGQTPFQTIQHYFDLKRPAAVRFDDLRAIVDSNVYYHQLPFQIRADTSRLNDEAVMVMLTLGLQPHNLTARPGTNAFQVNIYGRITGLSRQLISDFDDDLSLTSGDRRAVYQRKLPLRPGRYKLTCVVKDKNASRIGTQEQMLLVAPLTSKKLSLSSIVLAEQVKPATEQESIVDPFLTWSGWKIYPSLQADFSAAKPLYCYLEVYGFQLDQSSGSPQVEVSYSLLKDGVQVRKSGPDFSSQASNYLSDRISVLAAIPLNGLSAGKHQLEFAVRDAITGQSERAEASFTIPQQ